MNMGFVHEFTPEEDIKKFDLPGIWQTLVNDIPIRYVWVVDRERNAFLISYRRGREELVNRIDFALWWGGIIYRARLIQDVSSGPDKKLTNTWNLIALDYPADSKHSEEDVRIVYKDALSKYKAGGPSPEGNALHSNRIDIFSF